MYVHNMCGVSVCVELYMYTVCAGVSVWQCNELLSQNVKVQDFKWGTVSHKALAQHVQALGFVPGWLMIMTHNLTLL